MPNFARLLTLAAATAILPIVGAVAVQAQPPAGDPGDPVEVPMPRIVIADAPCDSGGARLTVWIDDTGDRPLHVRLRSGQITRTGDTAFDEEHWQHKVIFEAVPAGDYDIHVDGLNGPQDDVPLTVKPCGDPASTAKPLGVEVACKAGWGLVTFTMANLTKADPATLALFVGGIAQYQATLSRGQFLRVAFNAYDDRVGDQDYVAQLKAGKDVVATERFRVTCAAGNAPALDIASKCDGNTAQVGVGVLNPNRATIDYTVRLNDQTRTVSVPGGVRGQVTFPNVPNGAHPLRVDGGNSKASGTATVTCAGQTTTTTTTTPAGTTTPAPQGRSGGGLANTGAAVGGPLGLAALALLLGGTLVVAGRWRARRD